MCGSECVPGLDPHRTAMCSGATLSPSARFTSRLTVPKPSGIKSSGLQAQRTDKPRKTVYPTVPAEVQLTCVDSLGGTNPWRLRIIDTPEQDTSGAGACTKASLEDDYMTSTQEPSTSPGMCFHCRERLEPRAPGKPRAQLI